MILAFPTWTLARGSALTSLAIWCLVSPGALAMTSGSLVLARTLDKTVAVTNSPILVTATLTNTGPDTLRGFHYFDEVPTGLTVTTLSVSLAGRSLTNFSFASGIDGDVYAGCTPRWWWLETPTGFAETNVVPPQGVVQICYSISCATTGSFFLQDFGCAACKPDKTNALYGYSGVADQQTVSFVRGGFPPRSQLLSPLLQQGSMCFTLLGQAGSNYALETSTDLISWAELKRVTLGSSAAQISDLAAPGPRFYRARWVP